MIGTAVAAASSSTVCAQTPQPREGKYEVSCQNGDKRIDIKSDIQSTKISATSSFNTTSYSMTTAANLFQNKQAAIAFSYWQCSMGDAMDIAMGSGFHKAISDSVEYMKSVRNIDPRLVTSEFSIQVR